MLHPILSPQRLQPIQRLLRFIGIAVVILSVILPISPALAAQSPAPPEKITGTMIGEDWRSADQSDKQRYCERAYRAFRSSPSQSYIISSNVQALTPEGFCKRLDQFYSYEINEEIPLNSASGIAPLLFSDHPVQP